jgi:hypothetical protein
MGIVEGCRVDNLLFQWQVFNEHFSDVRIHLLLLLGSTAGCNTFCGVTIVLDVENEFNILAVCEIKPDIQE